MKYYVYIIKSELNSRYYIGYTTCVGKRINEHNKGSTKSTKHFRPWKLIYSEEFIDKNQAYKREWHLKHPKGYLEKLKILKQYGEVA